MDRKIVVVGDVMLDTYEMGSVSRVSPEAPVPVLLNPTSASSLGGAANVAHALSLLGAEVSLFGHTANDAAGLEIRRLSKLSGIQPFLSANLTLTTEKRRLFSHSQQIGRIDSEGKSLSADLIADLKEEVFSSSLLVISDYSKTMGAEIERAMSHARAKGIPFIVDPKGSVLEKYSGAYLLKPNLLEFSQLFGLGIDQSSEVIEVIRRLSIEHLLVTMGSAGGKLFSSNGEVAVFSAGTVSEVADVTGAGDVVTAGIATLIVQGTNLEEAISCAFAGAARAVGKTGANLRLESAAEILKGTKKSELEKLRALRRFADQDNAKIVWANGCFDLLHPGHIHLLQKAKSLGDFLVVGLNSDESVRGLKGASRPIVGEQERYSLVMELRSTDWVATFDALTPLDSILSLRPDVIVKGDDYQASAVVGYEEAKSWGGRVEIVDRVGNWSTSLLLDSAKRVITNE